MKNIPEKTIKRLSLYYRYLYFLSQQGTITISSRSLADLLELKPDQVRKDLSYFGGFGKTGTGYNVRQLKIELSHILGLDRGKNVALIGMGNLGQALLAYKGFEVFGFSITHIFDAATNKIGKKYRGKICLDIKEFPAVCRKENIEIAILTVPVEVAQEVADMATESKVSALLNFAPVHINVPKGASVNNIDLALELKSLSYFVSKQKH